MKKYQLMQMFMILVIIALPISIYGSFPTNTNVTFEVIPLSPGSNFKQVKLKVFDDQRGQEITQLTSFGFINNPVIKDGVIKWRENGNPNSIVKHFFAVYDPKCGCWKIYEARAVLDSDRSSGGLIAWASRNATVNDPPSFDYAIYDPEVGQWRDSTFSISALAIKISDTMIIYFTTNAIFGENRIQYHFKIYDPVRRQWSSGSSADYPFSQSFFGDIDDGTARFFVTNSSGTTNYKYGYNTLSQSWTNNTDTKPLPYFVPSNDFGALPLKTYMWDMSLGSNAWSWNFGDGGTSSVRSPFYTYSTVTGSAFTATLTSSGPGGSNTYSDVITPSSSHSISGTLSNQNGFKISNATVTLSGTVTGTTQTDANGNYSFANLSDTENYVVTASKNAYTFSPASISFNTISGNAIGNFAGTLNDTPADFDGDGKTDVSIYRPSSPQSQWWILNSSNSSSTVVGFGLSDDKFTPRDFDGDGKADVAVWRPSDGKWYIYRSSDNTVSIIPFGTSGDIPVADDYDGDDKADLAIFRPSDGKWYVLQSSDSQNTIVPFGLGSDKPAQGDYDGDGKADWAVFRPSENKWYVLRSSDLGNTIYLSLNTGGLPVQGDYDGDGKTDFAVFIPSSGLWELHRSSDQGTDYETFGFSTDILAPGDYDGDGEHDVTIYRPSEGKWYVLQSSNQSLSVTPFGNSTDIPTLRSYISE